MRTTAPELSLLVLCSNDTHEGIPTLELFDAFGEYANELSRPFYVSFGMRLCLRLNYSGEKPCEIAVGFSDSSERFVKGLLLSHSPRHPRFYDALFHLMVRGSMFLMTSFSNQILVTSQDVWASIPEEFKSIALVPVWVLTSEDLLVQIERLRAPQMERLANF